MDVDLATGVIARRADVTDCDREQIHLLGRVQSFGALLAVSSDWIVSRASANIQEFLGADPEALIGAKLSEHVSDDALALFRRELSRLSAPDAIERMFGVHVRPDLGPCDVAMHVMGGDIVLEFERTDRAQDRDITTTVYPMISRLSEARDVNELCKLAARQLRALTGFDRVMVYRFGGDASGTVVAEHHKTGMEPFLGLRYPASDIPQQARNLYKRNPIRIISDVNDPGHAILPPQDPSGQPLNLSLSSTRAVSPVHLQYLRNMGVEASMSVSILKRGQLWGLFACHNEKPRVLSYHSRSAAELFGQLFSFVLDQKITDEERADTERAQHLHDRLMAQIAEGSSIAENFETIVNTIEPVIAHDGAVAFIEDKFTVVGSAPDVPELRQLVRFLNTTAASRVYQTEHLSAVYPAAEHFKDRAAGMLVLPVSRTPRDYIILFRREASRTVTWAGDPSKAAEPAAEGEALTPRKSFAAWQETVEGQSEPWSPGEVRAAEALRVTLLEVILRMSDLYMQDRSKAQEQQELLIAELNHRVRNILNLIRSLVQQSRGGVEDVAQFTDVVGGRIQALARAHDQITKELWKPASTKELIRTEAEAYLLDKADRVTITGPDALIEPKGFTTLSLVIHELMTNAAKYGALADRNGRIELELTQLDDDGLRLDWTEHGGPVITNTPSRRGFGTTIIERSIPYELQGTADVRYEKEGLRAQFVVPPSYVASFGDAAVKVAARQDEREARTSLDVPVLLVEDNMIIALDAEQFLIELGAKSVDVASSVKDGLEMIERKAFGIAVLDVNLGSGTSEPIARALKQKGVPFVFATGYGDDQAAHRGFPEVPVVQKPYDRASLELALTRL